MTRMNKYMNYFRTSLLSAGWLMILTFPIMVIKVNTIAATVKWRWMNLVYVGIFSFILTWLWCYFIDRKGQTSSGLSSDTAAADGSDRPKGVGIRNFRAVLSRRQVRVPMLAGIGILVILFPLMVSFYQVGIITSALMFVILGLGLNIVIGYGGLLHLGYAAFYAVGAYNYGLLYLYLGLSFWAALPLGALSGMVFGLLIGIPVLRLRGDYLAIVTLAFGEITRLVLENLSGFTKGPEGIAQIPRPEFFIKLSLQNATAYLYYIAIAMVILTIFIIRRLEDSRIGRALEAMREDD
ncbi:MAG: branched-chain amino acid ABC transporter permease, partial [spirochete symbiont of Stewartia floridana]